MFKNYKITKLKILSYAYFSSILLVALIIRLYVLSRYGDMWGDEMFSFTYSQKPWLDSVKLWIWETNPPLHMLFLKLWFYVFPANEFFARLPSLIFGLLGVAALYRLGHRLFVQKTALIAALLLTLSPYHIYVSATARGYSLFFLLVVLSFDYFERVFIRPLLTKEGGGGWSKPPLTLPLRKGEIIKYALITLALLYLHLTAVIVLAAQFIILIIFNRPALWRWLKINLIPGSLWLIWAVPSLLIKFNGQTASSAWFLHIAPNAINLIMPLQIMFTGIAATQFGFFVMAIFFIGLFYTLFRRTKKPTPNFIIIFILIFFPIVFSYALGLYDIKFVASAYPWIMLASALMLCVYIKRTELIIILALAISLPGLQMLHLMLPFNDWSVLNRETNARLNPAKKQALVYSNYTDTAQLERYFKTPLPAIPYRDSRLGDNFDYDVITKNYLRFIHEEDEIKKWISQANLGSYDEIFVLQGDTLGIIDIASVLKKQNWKLKQPPVRVPLLGKYELYYFVRNF